MLCCAVPCLAVLCYAMQLAIPSQNTLAMQFDMHMCLQDPVPKVGKFGVLYARPGQRVILDAGGEMQVRPTQLDMRLSTLNPCKKINQTA